MRSGFWALEDCRHVSGSLERFLIERGERVLRIPTHVTAKGRKSARQRGKSDPIDAVNVARAALQEGLASFPVAHLDGPELDLRLLVDHRERLVRHRVELNNTLQWHLYDLWPELRLPGGALFSKKWSTRIGRRLARAEQTMRVRIARDELRRLRDLTVAINRLEREISASWPPPPSPPRSRIPPFPPRGGRRADPRQLGKHPAPPARPGRQPSDQRGASPHHRHPRPLPPAHTRLHRASTPPRQEHPRSDPLPQALPRPPRLAPTPNRPARSEDIPTHQFLDIEATRAEVSLPGLLL